MKRVTIFLFFILSLAPAFAQSPLKASFEGNVKDFGDVLEKYGTITHRFDFLNSGSDGLQIDSVKTSCGCTVTHWSAGIIEPNAKGYVEVTFNPHNRPGVFDKTMVVHYKNTTTTSSLNIRGFVISTPASIEQEFPFAVGKLRLKSKYLNLGNIPKRKLFSKSFEVYNSGNDILVFSDVMEGPNHLTITFEPYTLKPKTTGKLWVHYDVAAKNDLGYFREDAAIFTYEIADQRKDLIITSTLMDLPMKTGGNQATINIPKTIQDFGIKQQDDTVNVKYIIQNIGKSTLEIKKAFSSCNCMRVQLASTSIKPGGTTELRAMFLTHQRVGKQQKAITLFTNDPNQPVSVLTLKGLLRGPRD